LLSSVYVGIGPCLVDLANLTNIGCQFCNES
jgi:hypothetical protein